MVIFNLFPLLFFLTTAETTLNVPGLSKPKESRSSALPLTAEKFLDPLTDENRKKRPTTWPEKLTFSEPLNLTAEEALKKLQGEFRVLYHCDGKAVEAQYLAKQDACDGYIYSSINLEFKKNTWIRKTFPPGQRHFVQPEINTTCDLKIKRSDGSTNQFEFYSSNCKGTGNWETTTMTGSLMRVNETGETVLELSSSSLRCPDGHPLKGLLVPSNTLLISKI